MFYLLGHEACGILALQTGVEPPPPALEGEALTIGPPGKSLSAYILCHSKCLTLFTWVLVLFCLQDVKWMWGRPGWGEGRLFFQLLSASVLISAWPESKLNLSTSCFSKTRFTECWYVPGSHIHYFILSLQPFSGVDIFPFNCTCIYLRPTMCQNHHLVFLLAQHTFSIFLVTVPQVFRRRLASPTQSPNGSALVFCTPPHSSRSGWPGWPNQHCPSLWP